MENVRVADIFDEIADLLELEDANAFRVRSYRSAAQSVRGLSERLEDMLAEGRDLADIPNVGQATADKIQEILETGTCKRLEELHEDLPQGLRRLMDVPGLGPRKAMQIYRALEIDNLDDLKAACEHQRIRALDGMGAKTEEKILQGIQTVQSTAGRLLLRDAEEHLHALAEHLDGVDAVDRWSAAGSYRRKKETVGDLDVLVHADDRKQAADGILAHDGVEEVLNRGEERISVRLSGGLQVDFRFFDEAAFGAAMLYFTGSKAHNIKVRRRAQEKDWKLNEYGIFSGDRRLAGKTEEAMYSRLDLPWIAPELREDRGEVEAADEGDLPDLVETDQVRGDLQSHTTASDGNNSIREMAAAARDYGLDYLALTDHSKRVTMANGLNDDDTRRHAEAIREADGELDGFRLLAGIEVDILKSGRLDLKQATLESLDWVVASIHYDRNLDREAMTNRVVKAVESGVVHALGHPLGRIIGKRDPIALDLDRVFTACVEQGVRIEINCQPDRLDLPDHHCRRARDGGVGFTLGTDAHAAANFHYLPFGVNVARRGWLRAADVLNCLSRAKLEKELGLQS